MKDKRADPIRSERLERVKKNIARRIRGVCSHLDEAEFDALVTRMATIEIKYSQRSDRRGPDSTR